MPYYRRKQVTRKPMYKKRPYNIMRRRIGMRKKYQGVKYFTERIQYPNLFINNGGSTTGNYSTFQFTDLTNASALTSLFDLFSVVSLKWEVRPINSYSFGSSPVPAPNITYAIEENPDSWTSPTAKAVLLEKSNSKTRTLDSQRTSNINIYQKIPQCDANEQQVIGGNTVNVVETRRRKFKWYSIKDLQEAGPTYAKFGALRYWLELPNGIVSGSTPLEVAEHYVTVRYAVKEQV